MIANTRTVSEAVNVPLLQFKVYGVVFKGLTEVLSAAPPVATTAPVKLLVTTQAFSVPPQTQVSRELSPLGMILGFAVKVQVPPGGGGGVPTQ